MSGGQWLRPITRWAIYLRDGLKCVYCQISLQELLRVREGNFLTVDHMRARCRGGEPKPENLITCCYKCNQDKGRGPLSVFCRNNGYNYSTVRNRVCETRKKSLDAYREAARVLLGQLSDLPQLQVATIVVDHDWLVKSQWGHSLDASYWDYLQAQRRLFCPACSAPVDPYTQQFLGAKTAGVEGEAESKGSFDQDIHDLMEDWYPAPEKEAGAS